LIVKLAHRSATDGGQRGLFHRGEPKSDSGEDEDFALSAGKAGLRYPQLIDRIIRHGMQTVRG